MINQLTLPIKKEIAFESLAKLCAYIALPLFMMLMATIGFSLLSSGAVNTNVNAANQMSDVLISFSLPMLICLGGIPLIIKKFSEKLTWSELGFSSNKWTVTAVFVLISGALIYSIYSHTNLEIVEIAPVIILVHFFFVAVSEEIMLRSIIFHETGKFCSGVLNCILNGLIFAFIYHSSGDFISNLCFRFPLGFILAWIRWKNNSLYPAIMLHWGYNLFVTLI